MCSLALWSRRVRLETTSPASRARLLHCHHHRFFVSSSLLALQIAHLLLALELALLLDLGEERHLLLLKLLLVLGLLLELLLLFPALLALLLGLFRCGKHVVAVRDVVLAVQLLAFVRMPW